LHFPHNFPTFATQHTNAHTTMNSSQINFFMMPDDVAELEQYIKEQGLVIVADRMPENKLQVLDSLKTNYPITPYILKPEDVSNVKIDKTDNNIYYIDLFSSNVIEFGSPHINNQMNTLRAGRFYYIKTFFDANGELIYKNANFFETAEKLFKWCKSHFKNAKISKTWATKRVAEWTKNTNGQLIE